jgi:hypothetical protein
MRDGNLTLLAQRSMGNVMLTWRNWLAKEREATAPDKPHAHKFDFDVWNVGKKIGAAYWTAEGYIIVKLDADGQAKRNLFLYPKSGLQTGGGETLIESSSAIPREG